MEKLLACEGIKTRGNPPAFAPVGHEQVVSKRLQRIVFCAIEPCDSVVFFILPLFTAIFLHCQRAGVSLVQSDTPFLL